MVISHQSPPSNQQLLSIGRIASSAGFQDILYFFRCLSDENIQKALAEDSREEQKFYLGGIAMLKNLEGRFAQLAKQYQSATDEK